MVKTIGNPLSWGASALAWGGQSITGAIESLKSPSTEIPETTYLSVSDLTPVLRKGWADFAHFRSDVMMLVVFYPIVGLLLSAFAFERSLIPLLFPMAAGFALIGPLAVIGLYELSRRREAGESPSWAAALTVLRPEIAGPVFTLGLGLIGLYAVWLYTATWIYQITLGPELPSSISGFVTDIFTRSEGYMMLALGVSTGFIFAVIALCVSVLSFPMLIDRRVGLPLAVATSLRFSRQNPDVVALWGLIVAGLLLLATLTFFIGLVFVLPLLGHSTWHLYRAALPPQTPPKS